MKTALCGEADAGEEGGVGDPDFRVAGGQDAFGFRHVGTAFEQFGGKTWADLRWVDGDEGGREIELRRSAA